MVSWNNFWYPANCYKWKRFFFVWRIERTLLFSVSIANLVLIQHADCFYWIWPFHRSTSKFWQIISINVHNFHWIKQTINTIQWRDSDTYTECTNNNNYYCHLWTWMSATVSRGRCRGREREREWEGGQNSFEYVSLPHRYQHSEPVGYHVIATLNADRCFIFNVCARRLFESTD